MWNIRWLQIVENKWTCDGYDKYLAMCYVCYSYESWLCVIIEYATT